MFIDYAKIYIKGGDGGDGMVAYRRENLFPWAVRQAVMAVTAAALFSWASNPCPRWQILNINATIKRSVAAMAKIKA